MWQMPLVFPTLTPDVRDERATGRPPGYDCPFVNAGHGLLSAQHRVTPSGGHRVGETTGGRPICSSLEVPGETSFWFQYPLSEGPNMER
jgi:hypothetical protein